MKMNENVRSRCKKTERNNVGAVDVPMLSIKTPPAAGPRAAPPLKPAITGAIVRVRFNGVLLDEREKVKL